jgi:hypothetical protein
MQHKGRERRPATENHILLAEFSNAEAFSAHMSSTPSTPAPASVWSRRLRAWGLKLASLVVAGVVFGWGYSWAEPRFYRADRTAGFWLGTLHGALMPTALPCLLLGNNVPIFVANNTGRTYKLGYIAGINFCGLVFFGLGFRRTSPREPRSETG